MCYKLGIDIGSTTLKIVVMDEIGNIIYKSYERHLSKVRSLCMKKITQLSDILKGKSIKVAITGSAGLGVAQLSGIDFVQEVFATAGAVGRYYPMTDVVIELGGEDAKIIFLKGTVEERMNSTCAGGTGAFIDQMASLLNVTADELDELGLKHNAIYPIASRCGVFAKTDIQPLINQGAQKENIAASIFQAVVDQTIAGLAQGSPIEGNVLFLGGPLAFLKCLRQRFIKTLKLDEDHAIFPDIAEYFVALGAAVYADTCERVYTYDEICALLSQKSEESAVNSLPPLFETSEEFDHFIARHSANDVAQEDISSYRGDAYLGIDAGSTTTKVCLISEEKKILYSFYRSNLGSPLDIIKAELKKIYELCGNRIRIVSSAVTGYGEELLKNAFGIDYGIVETVAHYTAAKHFNPNADFIIDIGGQDIKCFQIKDGAVSSVMLNEACSSGCGSFIETFAKSLGYSAEDFAQIANFAKKPVDLGTRCTVFMNSSVKQAQKNGATVADISAGLAVSVVKNAIYKVIRAKNADELGNNIVVQGGTFLNNAVLRSFERLIGKDVIRPNIAGLMGAYGAALYARANKGESTLITRNELGEFTHTSKATRCGLCNNRCSLTINEFSGGRKFISGNRCEKPLGGGAAKDLPNLYKFKTELLQSLKSKEGKRGKIGIPMVLNMYENLPFWHEFFTELGFEVVTSGQSSRKVYAKGQHTIPSDTVCYPAKMVHGHIINLIEDGVNNIFYPCMTYNFDEGISDNCYNCPVVAYYPESIAANMNLNGVNFIYPYIKLNDKKVFTKKILAALKQYFPDITAKEVCHSAECAYRKYAEYKEQVFKAGDAAIAYAKENGAKTIVLAGRPYHIDNEINHGIDRLASSLGFVVLSEDCIRPAGKPDLAVLNQWTYHARMYNAAEFVTTAENTQLVQLVSFGCGIDAVTSDEVRDILRSRGKLYTQIKIDEINNLGAVKIRIRSLQAAMDDNLSAAETI
ncbi:MAG: 2-hydroxyacyl-CoA dehydratase [Clostridia bacterium]|nr:2-hydroxyacyl-CoA dehydratase [Clostridia bacterium]